jgi:alpha,alpha-trehalase
MGKDHSQDAGSMFPTHVLREYVPLAGGQRGAMVGPRGDPGWMCAPQWHPN